MIILNDGAYIEADRYHVWAEKADGTKEEIGEYMDLLTARSLANRYLFKSKESKQPTVYIKRTLTVSEYVR